MPTNHQVEAEALDALDRLHIDRAIALDAHLRDIDHNASIAAGEIRQINEARAVALARNPYRNHDDAHDNGWDHSPADCRRHSCDERAEAVGRCGCCGGHLRGSDHCQCCGCEEFEGACDHCCDGISCSIDHDPKGRPSR